MFDERWHTLQSEVRKQQEIFDGYVGQWSEAYGKGGGRLYCGKGCAGCCNLAVNCTFTEAASIAGVLSGKQASRVREHAQRQLAVVQEATDLKSYLKLHRQKIGPCPLLCEDGSCGIYGHRPFSCRALLSTGESRWCSTDFAALPAKEKERFMASLDRSVVAFPMHYVAATQQMGQQMESGAIMVMAATFGFAVSGSLPFLIFLEQEHHMSEVMLRGYDQTVALLSQWNLQHPFLVMLDKL